MEEIKLEPSEDLAYWVGVVQSDGYLEKYYVGKGSLRYRLSLGVCSKSLPMSEKFRDVSKRILYRFSKIRKLKMRDVWYFQIGIKKLLPLFKKLDIALSSPLFTPPLWVVKEQRYFGAYLAGLIDGDGCVQVKRPKYPQCVVILTSGIWQDFLAESIRKILCCSVYQSKRHQRRFIKSLGRVIEGTWHTLEFYVSSKTAKFVSDYIVPYIQLPYKKKTLQEFISERHDIVNLANDN